MTDYAVPRNELYAQEHFPVKREEQSSDTDDREALARLIHNLMVLQKVNTADDVAREVISAGFHREGPPTDAQVEFAEQIYRDHRFFSEGECMCGAPWANSHPMRAAIEAARRTS